MLDALATFCGYVGVILLFAGIIALALGAAGMLQMRWYVGLMILLGMLSIAGLFELPVFLQYVDDVREGRRRDDILKRVLRIRE